jgi:hypothetical protein
MLTSTQVRASVTAKQVSGAVVAEDIALAQVPVIGYERRRCGVAPAAIAPD